MDCIKDEAIRAKCMAEGMLEQNDYFGARLFALKAQSLFPTLDGISQLVTTLEVHTSAENKIRGEVDWYSVLGVDPCADDATISKQYRKLALVVHPDKNKCSAAEAAFKLISEARSVLLDPVKRSEYNERMGYGVCGQPDMGGAMPSWLFAKNVAPHMHDSSTPFWPFQPDIPIYSEGASTFFPTNTSGPSVPYQAHFGGPSVPYQAHFGGPSVPPECGEREGPSPKAQNRRAKAPRNRSRAPCQQTADDTFWTACNHCNRKYEHRKIFCNSIVLCQMCQKPFIASETVPPLKFVRTAKLFGRKCSISA